MSTFTLRLAPLLALSLLPLALAAQTASAPASTQAAPTQASAPSSAAFNSEQIEQLVAPIALYPDSLLSQVLMGATYPADVAEAAKWSKANKDQKGDTAVKLVQDKPWDPAVKALAAFPQVLQAMGDKPDWVQNLGDAFLASSKDVLDAVQRLRVKAQAAGNLKSNEQQNVSTKTEADKQVIIIEPAKPDVVYVPAYDPNVVYGPWPYPYYPPYYWPPYSYYYPGYYPGAFAAGVFWGVAVGSILWGNCNWGGGDININTDRFNNVNRDRQIDRGQNKFQHNAANRKGVPYRDQATRDKFDKGRGGAEARNSFRGRDPVTESRRQQAQSVLQSRGMDPAQAREQLRNDPATRQRAQAAADRSSRDFSGGARNPGGTREGAGGGAGSRDFGGGSSSLGASRDRAQALGGNDHALRGASNPGQSRQQFDRGSSSRQSMGGGGARGGGGRGGGGGRR
ncbi:DUF3300 domain-containing protein [Sphaerotilaceae bacterium SBD11-9]